MVVPSNPEQLGNVPYQVDGGDVDIVARAITLPATFYIAPTFVFPEILARAVVLDLDVVAQTLGDTTCSKQRVGWECEEAASCASAFWSGSSGSAGSPGTCKLPIGSFCQVASDCTTASCVDGRCQVSTVGSACEQEGDCF
eukprot:2977203-Rhodomonas_salina.1